MEESNTIDLIKLITYLKEDFYSSSQLAEKLNVPEEILSSTLPDLRRSNLGLYVIEKENGEKIKIDSNLSVSKLEDEFLRHNFSTIGRILILLRRKRGDSFTSIDLARNIGVHQNSICKAIREYNATTKKERISSKPDPTHTKRFIFYLEEDTKEEEAYDDNVITQIISELEKSDIEGFSEKEEEPIKPCNPKLTPLQSVIMILGPRITCIKFEGTLIEVLAKGLLSPIAAELSELNLRGIVQKDKVKNEDEEIVHLKISI